MAKKSPVKWGVVGALVGAVAALLMAPKSGKETRQDIKEGANKAKDEADKRYNQAKDEVNKRSRQVQKTAKTYSTKTKRAAKRAAADVKDEFSR